MDESKQRLRIGNYVMGRTIGRGTFAKVKEAVAIKILDKTKIEDEDDKQRILRQLQILRKVRHPNIIQLYQVFETEQQIYIINEFAEKGELFRLVNHQYKLQEKTCARIFLQIINAVEYLHRLGISHRDLKPENILLDFDYNVKLVDFGLSNYYKHGQLLKTACGSPCYAPPEMVAGKPYDGFISDVWSLGIIFFVMICGYLPFQQKTTKQLYAKIIEGHYELPKKISQDSKQVIQKMLTNNPNERIHLHKIRTMNFFKPYLQIQPVIIGIILGVHPMPIDLELLKHVSKHITKLDFKSAQQMIKSNKHNQITSTYYLLQKKVLRDGGKTNVDLQIYLESSKQYKKDYGQNAIEQIKSKSIQSVTNYERKNRSLKRKILTNKKTDRIESVTKKKNSNLKEKYRLKSQGPQPSSLQRQKSSTLKKRTRLNTLTNDQMQKTLTMSKNNDKIAKVWNTYLNNSLKLSQTTRVNVKDRQKQKLHQQNINKLRLKSKKNGKLPQISIHGTTLEQQAYKLALSQRKKSKQSPQKALLSHRLREKST